MELTEDKQRLKDLVLDNEEERLRLIQEKQGLINAQKQFLQHKGMLKEMEKQYENQQTEDYFKQVNAQNEVLDMKERMYKQFFKDFEKQASNRVHNLLDVIVE